MINSDILLYIIYKYYNKLHTFIKKKYFVTNTIIVFFKDIKTMFPSGYATKETVVNQCFC